MKDRIQKILERELNKLDALSSASAEPLDSATIKALDTLIKAHRSFTDPTKDPSTSSGNPAEEDPSRLDTETLLNGLSADKT